MKIQIISGSPRVESVTLRVALHLEKAINSATPHNASVIDMRQHQLPLLQRVWQKAEDAPIEHRQLAQDVMDSEGIILVSPEYNGSYSPYLKTLLDQFPKQARKPFGVVTASTGALGGMRAAQQMQLLASALFGILSPSMLIVPEVQKKFNEAGDLIDINFERAVQNFVSEYNWLANKLGN